MYIHGFKIYCFKVLIHFILKRSGVGAGGNCPLFYFLANIYG